MNWCNSSSVKGAKCTCSAAYGSYEHIAAFCFALEDFVRTRGQNILEGVDPISCTSIL